MDVTGEEKPEMAQRDAIEEADQDGHNEEVKASGEWEKGFFMMTFNNCLCLGHAGQAGTSEPERSEASRLASSQDATDPKTAENGDLQDKQSPRPASPTQKVALKYSPDPGGRHQR